MKKKILSLIMSICLVIPFAVILTACDHEHDAKSAWTFDATHHYHECKVDGCEEKLDKATHTLTTVTVTPATIDSEGSEKQVCECGYETTPTTIPKLIQSTDEIMGILHTLASRDDEYTYLKLDSADNMAGLMPAGNENAMYQTTHFARNDTAITTYIVEPNTQKPGTWQDSEYISFGQYLVKGPADTTTYYHVGPDNAKEHVVVSGSATVQQKYVDNYVLDKFNRAFAFAKLCDTETELKEILKDSVIELLDKFANEYYSYGSVNKDDIHVMVNTSYVNQKYTLTVNVYTDDVTYASDTRNTFKIDTIALDYTMEFNANAILKISNSINASVTKQIPGDDNSFDMLSTNVMYLYKDTSMVNEHLNKMDAYVQNGGFDNYERKEKLIIYADGMPQLTVGQVAGAKMNTYVDTYLAELNSTYEGVATFTAYLDEDYTIPYVASADLLLDAYYETYVYVKVTLIDTTKCIVHTTYYETYLGYRESCGHTLLIVDAGEYNVNTNFSDTEYSDVILVNHVPKASATVTLTANASYIIDCEKAFDPNA